MTVTPVTSTETTTSTTMNAAHPYTHAGDNYCVSASGVDLPQTVMSAGDASRDACAAQCTASSDCSGFEWYASGWNGVSCYRIPQQPAAAQASTGSRWRDSECWVPKATMGAPCTPQQTSTLTWTIEHDPQSTL